MRSLNCLAKQACYLLPARGLFNSWTAPTHFTGMQRLLHVHARCPTTPAHAGSRTTYLGCPNGSSVHGCFAAVGLSQHRKQHESLQPITLTSRRHWRHTRLDTFPAASSAAFTVSAPSHSAHDHDEGPEGELHAVETAIRANALIFAAKLGVFFISNSR